MKKINIYYKKVLNFTFLTYIIAILFFSVSCHNQTSVIYNNLEEPKNKEPNIENPVILESSNLSGTVWKLSGLISNNSEDKKTFGPEDCEDCYTLWFDTDFTATSISISKRIKLDLREDNRHVQATDFLVSEFYDKDFKEYWDSDEFVKTLQRIGSYSIVDDELKLFTYLLDEQGNWVISSFLLFYRIDRNPPTTLRGTKWKLSFMVDEETVKYSEFSPTYCEDCYTITFLGDSLFFYRSIWVHDRKDLSNLEEVLDPTSSGLTGPIQDEPIYAEKWCDYLNPDWNGECIPFNDSYLFRYGISYIKSYKLNNNELKFYFNFQEKNYYLLFKLIYK